MKFQFHHILTGVFSKQSGHWLLALCLLAFSAGLAAQEWESLPSVIPEPRDEHASCVIGQYIYLLGGAVEESGPALPDNLRYDTLNDTWTTRAPMPTARKNHAAVASDGKCYVIGGQSGSGPAMGVVEIYDPASDSWSAGADLPTAREGLRAGAVGGLIYAVGGESDGYKNELEVYDPGTNAWASRSPMPTARSFAAAGTLGGKLYVAGGTNAGLTGFLDVLEVYDPSNNQWLTRAPMPKALFYSAGAASGTKLWVTGGIGDGGTVARTYIYNPVIDFWATRSSLKQFRNRHVMEKAGARLFALGGAENVTGTPHLTTDTLEALDISVDFVINAGLNDAWVSDQAPFQGLFITVFGTLGKVFLSWFTFDSDGAIPNTAVFGSSDQSWVTGLGDIDGNTAVIPVELTSGGVFNASDPLAMQDPGYGTITIVFKGCSEAMVTYEFPSVGLSGQMTIHRVLESNVGLCETLALVPQSDPEPAGLEGITARHNEYRTTVGIPPLEWDPELAAVAQAWAEQCVDENGNGLIDHNAGRHNSYPGVVGENIFGHSIAPADPIQSVEIWAAEEANYDIVSNSCSGVCGHWTQVVWKDSVRLGCGIFTCPDLRFGASIVCNYSPSGNFPGQWPYPPPQ